MEFRKESFIEFSKKIKLPFVYRWPMNFAVIVILIFFIYHKYKTNTDAAIIGSSIIALGYLGLKSFLFYSYYTIYTAGGQAVQELGNIEKIILIDVPVYIKGFDILDRKKFFPPSINRTIYQFDNSDIVFTKKSMILLGKTVFHGGDAYAYPVEITNDNSLTRLTKVHLDKWIPYNDKIEITINDPNYKNSLKIEFYNKIVEIRTWLESHYSDKK